LTYEVIWSERAIDQAAGFLQDDPKGLEQLLSAVDLLADEPRPDGTTEYGSPDLRRLHVGRYRVLYDVSDSAVTVVVIHAGRLG
jgi:mRNA interferase RelE/StbE